MPVGECGFALESILEDLQRDPWPKAADQRPARCTGVALSVAVSLLERATGRSGGRVLVFAGGPCTVGPGKVVDRDLKEVMRSHTDLQKENAPHFKKACEFYRVVADRLVGSGHAVDFFGCSGDQLGLLELRPWLARSMFSAAQDPVTGFPFMVQSISLTARCLGALRLGHMNALCNAYLARRDAGAGASAGAGVPPVLRAFFDFHAALSLAFTRRWRESGATIHRMGHVMEEVCPPACRRPERCVAELEEAERERAGGARAPPAGSVVVLAPAALRAAAAQRAGPGTAGGGGGASLSFSKY
jgi:hypothetical protein